MGRLTRVLAAVAVVGTAHVATPDACAQQVPLFTGVQVARLGLGSIQGVVSDERGGPLAGAMVSAHGATAWRLRHLKRSVLKDSGEVVAIAAADDEELPPPPSSLFGRAFDSAASMASSLFTDLPFSGEVNLLTTSAFMPGQMFSGDFLPRGVAYVSLGAPLAGGEWTARASMTQSDLSSWIVAGSFSSHRASSHSYGFGV